MNFANTTFTLRSRVEVPRMTVRRTAAAVLSNFCCLLLACLLCLLLLAVYARHVDVHVVVRRSYTDWYTASRVRYLVLLLLAPFKMRGTHPRTSTSKKQKKTNREKAERKKLWTRKKTKRSFAAAVGDPSQLVVP